MTAPYTSQNPEQLLPGLSERAAVRAQQRGRRTGNPASRTAAPSAGHSGFPAASTGRAPPPGRTSVSAGGGGSSLSGSGSRANASSEALRGERPVSAGPAAAGPGPAAPLTTARCAAGPGRGAHHFPLCCRPRSRLRSATLSSCFLISRRSEKSPLPSPAVAIPPCASYQSQRRTLSALPLSRRSLLVG